VGHPVWRALAKLGADLCADVGLHELGDIQATDSRSTSACSLASSLSASWAAVILALSAIVVSPFVALLEQTDDHEARDGRTHIRPRGLATPRSATRPRLTRSNGLVTGMKGRGCRLRPRIGCWWSPVS
jgi:hypothetical protein